MTTDHYCGAVPVVSAFDVAATVAWFERVLGFTQQWSWGEPPLYAGVKGGGAMIYICHDPELAATLREKNLAPDIFLWVKDIEALYAEHLKLGVAIEEELSARPWGVRQYVVREPNGYKLKIAQSDEAGDE